MIIEFQDFDVMANKVPNPQYILIRDIDSQSLHLSEGIKQTAPQIQQDLQTMIMNKKNPIETLRNTAATVLGSSLYHEFCWYPCTVELSPLEMNRPYGDWCTEHCLTGRQDGTGSTELRPQGSGPAPPDNSLCPSWTFYLTLSEPISSCVKFPQTLSQVLPALRSPVQAWEQIHF